MRVAGWEKISFLTVRGGGRWFSGPAGALEARGKCAKRETAGTRKSRCRRDGRRISNTRIINSGVG